VVGRCIDDIFTDGLKADEEKKFEFSKAAAEEVQMPATSHIT